MVLRGKHTTNLMMIMIIHKRLIDCLIMVKFETTQNETRKDRISMIRSSILRFKYMNHIQIRIYLFSIRIVLFENDKSTFILCLISFRRCT